MIDDIAIDIYIFKIPNLDTVFCLPSICVPNPENSKNIIFSPWGHGNIYIDVAQPVRTAEYLKCHSRSNWPKCPWSTLGWPKVKVSQNHPKMTFSMFLHQTWVIRWFSSILTKFDLRLTLGALETLILTWLSKRVGTSAIVKIIKFPFPMTIHVSKSDLKWLRYLENRKNRISTLLKTITFDPTIGISISLMF